MANQDRDYIFSKLFEHLSVKKEVIENKELIRPILPVREWVKDPYYVGEQGLSLYPFWRKVIEDVFKDDGELRYNICIAGGGIGCRPLNTRYETSEGFLSLKEISQKLKDHTVFINTEIGKERIIDTHVVGNKNITILNLSDGTEFIGSSDHLLKVFDGNTTIFKKLSDIDNNDCILKLKPNTILRENKYTYLRVLNKSYSYGLVGDIEVEGSHTYISDGIINHNTGKSTAGVYLMVRFLYELSCYNNIHKHLGLRMDTSALVLLLFCITKKQIKNTTFKKLKETIDDIPYFKEHFPRYERVNDELRFPKNVLVLYGSGTGDALGLDLACSLVDEANFFSDASGNSTDMSEVADLHRSLIARQESRFMSNGKNRALSIVVSSSTYSSGYTEELKKRSLTDPTIKYYRARLWDVRPKGTYSSEVFYVFCGNDKVDPFIINDVMDLSARLNARVNPNMSIKEAISLLPNDLRVLVDDVPIDFRRQYDVNLLKSIQDVSGFSIQGTGGLFNNRAVFDACIDYSLPVLFTKNEFVIETQNDSPQNSIMYYLSGVPFSHPECPRFVHVDLSLSTDTTGISCCYKYGEKEVDGVLRPVYYYDFCIRILPPPPPKKISIARVEEFIMYMRDRLHITFGMISYDSFQSSSSQQHLQELGFPIRTQSVDRTDKAYLFFVDQMFLGTVKFNLQFANVIEHELFNLQHNRQKHKVDHILDTAHGYTKDVCDAVVGSLYNALECSPKEINNDDTLSLAYYNSSGNHARFTEESSWLFEEDSRAEQIKEIMEQEYGFMYKKGIL